MKCLKKIGGIPVIAVILACCVAVAAVGIMKLSNTVTYENELELPITLAVVGTSATPGGDLPDYAAGDLQIYQQYDMLVQYTTSAAIESGAIIVEFQKVGVSPTDLTFSWTDGTVWSDIAWTDSGDVLTGVLGYVGSQPASETVSYFAKLVYHEPGAYQMSLWVEGATA